MSVEFSAPGPNVAAGSQATPERPWLGLAHFAEADSNYFYGRDAEVRELTGRVRRAPLTVLYGVSGYGKSSLIGAGLIPALRAARHPIVLLRRCYDDLALRPLQSDVIAACVGGIPGCLRPERPDAITLWEFFHDRRQPWFQHYELGEQDDPAPDSTPWPVLLFDQFEEIFIKGEDRGSPEETSPDAAATAERARADARDFLTQLADLVENRPPAGLQERLQSGTPDERRALVQRFDFQARPVRVAVVIRDDFLARLERWRRAMPSLMEHRVELRLLSGPEAFKAVFEPGTKRPDQPPILPRDVAEAIVRAAAGAGRAVPLDEIDAVPPILSLLCERLNDRRLSAVPAQTIATLDVGGAELDAFSRDILGDFYERSFNGQPRALRGFVETRMLTDGGVRCSVEYGDMRKALKAGGVAEPNTCIDALVASRLISSEERRGYRWLEITHDVLSPIVRASRDKRVDRQRRSRAAIIGGAAALFIALLAALTLWALRARDNAKRESRRANEEAEHAEREKASALDAKAKAEALATARKTDLKSASWAAFNQAQRLLDEADNEWQMAEAAGSSADGDAIYRRKSQEALLHLARAVRFDPENRVAKDAFGWNVVARRDAMARVPLLTLPHADAVFSANFSPDGTRVVTASWDRTATIWEVGTGKLVATLPHEQRVWSANFTSDGMRVFTVSGAQGEPGTMTVWEAATGKLVTTVLYDHGVRAASYSVDGMRLVTVNWDMSVNVWETATGKLMATLQHKRPVRSASFSPDGTHVVTAIEDTKYPSAIVWKLETGDQCMTLTHDDVVWSASFSPDGTRVVTASRDGTARVWEVATAKLLVTLHNEFPVWSANFSPDGIRVVTAGGNEGKIGTTKVWEAASGELVATLPHDQTVWSASFSSDGMRIITASGNLGKPSAAKLWDATQGRVAMTLPYKRDVVSASFSADGTRMVTVSAEEGKLGAADVWEAGTGRLLVTLQHAASVKSAVFSADGTRVVTAGSDNTAKVWEAATGKLFVTLQHTASVGDASFSSDGKQVITASDDNTVKIWETATGKLIATLPHEGRVHSAGFSADGSWVITASAANGDEGKFGVAKIWESGTSALLVTLKCKGRIHSAIFNARGTQVVTASGQEGSSGVAAVWEAATGKLLVTLGHPASVRGAVFSADGTRVVTASDDNTAKVWEAATGNLVATLLHPASVKSAVFSADGTRVVTAGSDNTAKVWDAGTGKLIATLPHRTHVKSAMFSPDGMWMITLSNGGEARVWDAKTGTALATGQTRENDHELYEAVAEILSSERLSEDGYLRPLTDTEYRKTEARLAAIAAKPSLGGWFAEWLLASDPNARLTPFGTVTLSDRVEVLLANGDADSLREALALWPSHPLLQIALAAYEHSPQAKNQPKAERKVVEASDSTRATFLREYGLRHLPNDAAFVARAVRVLSAQKDLPRATRALQILEKLAPEEAAMLKKALSL